MTSEDAFYNSPTAAELVDAVREFLQDQVLDATSGSVGFHVRVAINALSIVHRELTASDDAPDNYRREIAALGYPDSAAFAEAIAAGDLDDRSSELNALLTRAVAAKLQVDNPRLLEK
ncbi:DUF6285 domain-containing protein [Gordonia sp. (in: high G+C Gram-positive bacteria)]|uniref:DUF6285 domain-containing protein n=1 Tax=Gordonia sp. (in: high G+C Gram-positive bacteria) TaxID=84139 RepID=UPI003C729BCC